MAIIRICPTMTQEMFEHELEKITLMLQCMTIHSVPEDELATKSKDKKPEDKLATKSEDKEWEDEYPKTKRRKMN